MLIPVRGYLKTCQHQFDHILKDWQSIYNLNDLIYNDIYEGLLDKPSEKEWMSTLRSINADSVPGSSGIGYKMLQHLSPATNNELCNFSEFIFMTSVIPSEWNQSHV